MRPKKISNAISRHSSSYTQKSISKTKQLSALCVPKRFSISDIVEQHPCGLVKSRPRPTFWQSGTSRAQPGFIILHFVQSRASRTCWRHRVWATPYPGLGIYLPALQRFASHVTDTINSCRGQHKSWINPANTEPCLPNGCKLSSLRSRKAIAECHAKSNQNRSVGHLLHRLYEHVEKTLDEVFDCSIKRWMQSILFMNAFAARNFSSSRFTPPVANFVHTHTDEIAGE